MGTVLGPSYIHGPYGKGSVLKVYHWEAQLRIFNSRAKVDVSEMADRGAV